LDKWVEQGDAMSFTYSQLKQAIQDYTENNETSFVNNLPIFIRQAEERILKNVQLSLFRKNVSGSMSASNKYLSCPTDFLAPFSLSFTDGSNVQNFLDFKDADFVQAFNPNASVTGNPRFYAVFDVNNFILGPTPSSSFAVELHYFYRPASLTAGAEGATTWLSENAEISMLYGSLLEAYIYMKGEPDLMQQYEKRFVEAITGLKLFGEAKEVTDEYRTGMVLRPKQ
jgi:ribosome biogenesis protein Nip4